MKYTELPYKAKEKVHNKFLEWYDFDEQIEDWVREQTRILTAKGWTKVKIYYDLGCHQGAGCSFEFRDFDIVTWLKECGYYSEFEKLITAFEELDIGNVVIHERIHHHYDHYKSRTAQLISETGQVDAIFSTQLIKLNKMLAEKYLEDAYEMERSGRSLLFDDLYSQEFVIDFYENNPTEFDEDGDEITEPEVESLARI